MPPKKKENYASAQTEANPRDNFQTPRYATELLLPYLPPPSFTDIWECANGDGAISRVLRQAGYRVWSSDIRAGRNNIIYDFLAGFPIPFPVKKTVTIVTNPPFSSRLKRGFYNRCIELGFPFALLIPADYAGWLIDAVRVDGCKKIIPTRRIDYITPFIEELVFKGEALRLAREQTKINFKKYGDIPLSMVNLESIPRYNSVEEIPEHLIGKYSSSNFHSMWLTRGVGRFHDVTEIFVELTNENKKRIL